MGGAAGRPRDWTGAGRGVARGQGALGLLWETQKLQPSRRGQARRWQVCPTTSPSSALGVGASSPPAPQPTGPLPSPPQETKGSVAVRVALGETQLVQEVRRFLVENGVRLDSFSQVSALAAVGEGLSGLGPTGGASHGWRLETFKFSLKQGRKSCGLRPGVHVLCLPGALGCSQGRSLRGSLWPGVSRRSVLAAGPGPRPSCVPRVFTLPAGGRRAKQDRDSGEEPAGRHPGGRAAGDLRPLRQPGPRAAARGRGHRHRGVPGAPGGPQGLPTPGLFQGRAAQTCSSEAMAGPDLSTVFAWTWLLGTRSKPPFLSRLNFVPPENPGTGDGEGSSEPSSRKRAPCLTLGFLGFPFHVDLNLHSWCLWYLYLQFWRWLSPVSK